MAGATPWTELSITGAAWQEGFPDPTYDASTDYFIDFLFEGSAFFGILPTSFTELSISATAYTELTAPATAYTELTL